MFSLSSDEGGGEGRGEELGFLFFDVIEMYCRALADGNWDEHIGLIPCTEVTKELVSTIESGDGAFQEMI